MAKKTTLEQLDQKLDEFMDFMKERVAMSVEVQEVRTELRSELQNVRTELRSEIHDLRSGLQLEIQGVQTGLRSEILAVADQVTKLQETVEIELVAPTRRMDRLERRVTVVERKLGLAT